MPGDRPEARRVQQAGGPPLGACLAGPAEDQCRDEPSGELIDQNEMAAGDQNPVALGQSRLLVRPVIERGHADHQVERAVPERQVLGHADREPQPLVAGNEQGRGRGDLDHSRRRVDPGQFGGARAAAGQQPEQITAPAADIEHSLGCRGGGQGDLGGLVGDVVMKPTEPSLVISGGPLVEGGHIAVPGWRGIAGHLNRPHLGIVLPDPMRDIHKPHLISLLSGCTGPREQRRRHRAFIGGGRSVRRERDGRAECVFD